MSRKPIQIALTTEGDLYALCDDGTMWIQATRGWSPVEGIPQEPVEAAPEITEPAPTWPPGRLIGLWAERPSGTLVRIGDEAIFATAVALGWRFLEADSEANARFVAGNRDRLRFRHNDVEYQYTPAIPF